MCRASGFENRCQYSMLLRNTYIIRTFILICSFKALFILFLIYDSLLIANKKANEKLMQSVIDKVSKDFRYADTYRMKERLPKDFKYILLWGDPEYAPLYFYGNGQTAFIKNNCSYVNCYVTYDKHFLFNDVTKFDAIGFNGRENNVVKPQYRSPHQRYIFLNMESSHNCPICDKAYDGFFNWTATYKLDSDLPTPYLDIRDMNNNILGPKINMHWKEMGAVVFDNDSYVRWRNKTKAAAWFVSNCSSRNNRTELAKALQEEMLLYDMKLYIYGKCGKFKCPRSQHADCAKMLESEFFFYLSFENSFAEDYVTEKLLNAVQHDTIPIVYGGANYSRFLPPNSYLDASNQTVQELAAMMYSIIDSPKLYEKYFQWKQHYTYHNRTFDQNSLNVCNLCEALNNESMMKKKKVYVNFREWWNPNYKQHCQGRAAVPVCEVCGANRRQSRRHKNNL